ncbi:MAG: hypothetical protein ACKO81_03860 [Planctomycetota bacterium]
MQLLDELQKLIAVFNQVGIEYVVCGGVAMAILGRPRMTVELNLLVAAEHMAAAIRVAEGVGFSDHCRWIEFTPDRLGPNRLYRLNKFSGEDFLTLDLLDLTEQRRVLLSGKQVVEFRGELLPTISREGLIEMKSLSGRKKDLLDIELLNSAESEPL